MRVTNPLKVKKKIKTTSKSSNAYYLNTVKVNKKPAFAKSCMQNINAAVALASANSRSANTAIKKFKYDRYTLDIWKLYLNSCTTYHSFFAKECLTNIKDGDTTSTDSCNVGSTVTNISGWWEKLRPGSTIRGLPTYFQSHA